jgi:tRNA threonylcarbamoyladenosine modification (KEOPS) complex Cgi121 subunit
LQNFSVMSHTGPASSWETLSLAGVEGSAQFPLVRACLVSGLAQSAELHDCIRRGHYRHFLFVRPSLIGDRFALTLAVLRALTLQRDDKMVTKNLGTDVLCALGASRSIKTALKSFGVRPHDTDLCILSFGASPSEFDDLAPHLGGAQLRNLDELPALFDAATAAQVFRLSPSESAHSPAAICQSVIQRRALGELVLKS